MTTRSPEHATSAAEQLRTAFHTIEEHAPNGPDRVDLMRRLGLMIAAMEGIPAQNCRTCNARFGLSRTEVLFYRQRGLTFPRHCKACRVERREKRAVFEGKKLA